MSRDYFGCKSYLYCIIKKHSIVFNSVYFNITNKTVTISVNFE